MPRQAQPVDERRRAAGRVSHSTKRIAEASRRSCRVSSPINHSRGRGRMTFQFRTRAEQRLEWLMEQKQHRRLTDEEWREVSRCEHAIYERNRRQKVAA